MIVRTFAGSDSEPPEYVSTNEVYCATPTCAETLDFDEEGWPSMVYDGRVCYACHEAEKRAAEEGEEK